MKTETIQTRVTRWASTTILLLSSVLSYPASTQAQSTDPQNIEDLLLDVSPPEIRSSAPVRSANQTVPSGDFTRAQIEQAAARYRNEPTVSELLPHLAESDQRSRLGDLADRSRLSALLPTFSTSVRRLTDQDLGVRSGTTGFGTQSVVVGNAWVIEGSLSFRLDRLLFASDEIRIRTLDDRLRVQQHNQGVDLIHTYFERRRLQLLRDLSEQTSIELEVQIAELTALLDLMTEGHFTLLLMRDQHP